MPRLLPFLFFSTCVAAGLAQITQPAQPVHLVEPPDQNTSLIDPSEKNTAPKLYGNQLTQAEHKLRLEYLNYGHLLGEQMDMLKGITNVILDLDLIINSTKTGIIDHLVLYEVNLWCDDKKSPVSKPFIKEMQNKTFYFHFHFKCSEDILDVCVDNDFQIEKKRIRYAENMFIPTTGNGPMKVPIYDKYEVCELATNRSAALYTVYERMNDINVTFEQYLSEEWNNGTMNDTKYTLSKMWHTWKRTVMDEDAKYQKLHKIPELQDLEDYYNKFRTPENFDKIAIKILEQPKIEIKKKFEYQPKPLPDETTSLIPLFSNYVFMFFMLCLLHAAVRIVNRILTFTD